MSALAHVDLAYRLAARQADIVYVTPPDITAAAGMIDEVRAEQAAAGRERETPHVFADLVVFLDGDAETGADRKARLDELDGAEYTSDARIFTGTPAELADLLAQRHGLAARYLPELAPFVALADPDDPQAWRDAAALVGPGGSFAVAGAHRAAAGWTTTAAGAGGQMVDVSLEKKPDPEALRARTRRRSEILDLVTRTEPGPFKERTVELGTYLGIRRGGALVAMAGERLHPEGWTEISAVCTDPAYRRQGLAGRLVSAVAAGIADRGEQVLLHASATNITAIRLYAAMGFRLRLVTQFHAITTADR